MKKVRITVMRMGCYPDLMAEYENPMEHPCDMVLGQVFVADGWNRPEGLCLSAWEEKSALGHDLLQRRLPARELSVGGNRRLTRLLY